MADLQAAVIRRRIRIPLRFGDDFPTTASAGEPARHTDRLAGPAPLSITDP